jgi:hypothetical protein
VSSKEAAHYDTKHEKTLNKLIEEIRAKLDFIGADWVEDNEANSNEGVQEEKTVRLLDYACGTGVGTLQRFPSAVVPLWSTRSFYAAMNKCQSSPRLDNIRPGQYSFSHDSRV